MRRLRYLGRANRDFADIAQWLLEQDASEAAAERTLEALDRQCRRLAENPATLGRLRIDLGLDLRSFPFRRYLIFFRYVGGILEVVRVVHGARDLPALFESRED